MKGLGRTSCQVHYRFDPPVGDHFAMYETDIDLQKLGLSRKRIVSIDFSDSTACDHPDTPAGPSTAIFAVSGAPSAFTEIWPTPQEIELAKQRAELAKIRAAQAKARIYMFAHPVPPKPIAIHGFNANVIMSNDRTVPVVPVDAGTACFYTKGLVTSDGQTHNDGLPSGNFTSKWLNNVTGGHSVFTLQPPATSNGLLIRATGSYDGRLTLDKPGKYSSLAFLACGFNTVPDCESPFMLEFKDARRGNYLFCPFDWETGKSNIALGGFGCTSCLNPNEIITMDGDHFDLYETDVDLKAIGASDLTLVSIRFLNFMVPDQRAVPDSRPSCCIFAVSGVPTVSTTASGQQEKLSSPKARSSYSRPSIPRHATSIAQRFSPERQPPTSAALVLQNPLAPKPIPLSGFNANIIASRIKTVPVTSADFDGACFYENGLVGPDGTVHNDGLPNGQMLSQWANDTTGAHAVFDLIGGGQRNVLLLNNQTQKIGTLRLKAPGAYRSLAVLATGCNCQSDSTGELILKFADGSSSNPIPFNSFDWAFGPTHIALGGLGRTSITDPNSFQNFGGGHFALYETDVDLVSLGYAKKRIASIDFVCPTSGDQPQNPYHGPYCSIFAVSGLPAN